MWLWSGPDSRGFCAARSQEEKRRRQVAEREANAHKEKGDDLEEQLKAVRLNHSWPDCMLQPFILSRSTAATRGHDH
jgi:hypothetical protein